MSNTWETTTDDVLTVLAAYDVSVSNKQLEEIHRSLDHEDIGMGAMYFTTVKVQTHSRLSDIEDYLLEKDIVPKGEKKFIINEEDDFYHANEENEYD